MTTLAKISGISLAVTIVVTACSDAEPDTVAMIDSTMIDTTVAAATASDAESTNSTPAGSLPSLDELAIADLPGTSGDLEEYTTPALGGVRYGVATEHTPFVLHDSIVVFTGQPGPLVIGARAAASIGLVTQSIAATPLSTADDFLATVAAVDDAVIEPTGDAIELLGHRLRGYVITNDAEVEEPKLFSSTRFGAPVDTEFAPFPYAVVYLADTQAGLLIAMMTGSDEADARSARVAMGDLISTAQFTGPGLDEPLPVGEAIAPGGVAPPPEPAVPAEDGPPALEALFANVEPGSYRLPNVGRNLTIDVGDDWVAQPNFPGIVVFSGPNGAGPNDRDVIIVSDVVHHLPSEAGPRAGGAPVSIADVDELLASPPAGFTISDVERWDGDNGELWTRFDISAAGELTCELGVPCEAAFVTSYGFVKVLSYGFDHRVFWITHDTGPDTVIFVSAMDRPDFIERATALVGTIRFE